MTIMVLASIVFPFCQEFTTQITIEKIKTIEIEFETVIKSESSALFPNRKWLIIKYI